MVERRYWIARIEEAWKLCFGETREWYENKRRALERKKRFYHGVQAATDFVEIRQEGHWKVDLLHHTVNEKGTAALRDIPSVW